MINGFVVEIKNAINQKHSVCLFSREELPGGVTVTTRKKDYDYKALFSLANSKGFKGSGINADEEVELIIHNGLISETFVSKFLTDKHIEIDGDAKFITVIVPAMADIIFQLMPVI